MTLRLPAALRVRMLDLAIAVAPREACGTLLGRIAADAREVVEIAAGRNLAPTACVDRFELDPLHLVEADAMARARGLEVIGVWHSHPTSAAQPSRADRDGVGGAWPCAIVSLPDRAIRAWRLVDGGFVEDDLVA